MYTKESFCNLVLRTTYSNAIEVIKEKPYKEFYIPKKNGKRTISRIDDKESLALLQKQLVKNFLDKQQLPVCVKGFRKGESYNSFLTPHIGARFFLRIDINNFFPSLKADIIKRELDKIINFDSDDNKKEVIDLITEIVTFNGSLPQGAFTSPIMSNILMTRIDQRLLKYCQALDVKYTRYADDLLFSSFKFCFSEKKWFIKKVKHILSENSLKVNFSKLKYAEQELALNGYIISSTEIRLSRNRLYDIKKILSYIDKNYVKVKEGNIDTFLSELNELPLKHRDLKTNSFNSVFKIVQYLNGYRAFLISAISEEESNSKFQKNMQKLINKIEKQVVRLT